LLPFLLLIVIKQRFSTVIAYCCLYIICVYYVYLFVLLFYPIIFTPMAHIRKPTVKIVLMKHKTLQNGENPVALRVTFDRKSRYFVLKGESKTLSCSLNKWNTEFGRYNRNKDTNHLLTAYDQKANDVLKKLTDTDFTFSRFEDKYFRKQKRVDVFDYFNECIDKLKSNNRLGSASIYFDTTRRLQEFTNGKKITFHDIDLNFIKRLERYLKGRGNRTSTIGIYLRTLRAVYNSAIEAKFIPGDLYPFKEFRIQKGGGTNRALSKESINQLRKYKAKKGSVKWHSLNFFIFSYLCRGINFLDMANLKWKENIKGEKLSYLRAKTANTKNDPEDLIIKIEPEIAEILSYYSNNDPYIFPILTEGLSEPKKRNRVRDKLKTVNQHIKEIAKEIGLQEADEITFYFARHTWASILKDAGVPTSIISEGMDHSDEKTTQAYLDKFGKEKIDSTYKHLL